MDNLRIVGDYKFPKWTRKDFQFLADMIHDLDTLPMVREKITNEFTCHLLDTNIQFDAERFIGACIRMED